jgi:succinate dehydrogenase hydrophobic membrane anchor protein
MTRLFQVQRYTAILLVVFMALHMIVVHYPPGHIDFSRVIERLENPVWKAIDIAFLLTVLLHGLSGLWVVLVDIGKVNPYRKALAVLITIVGVVAFVYGTMTIIAFQMPT